MEWQEEKMRTFLEQTRSTFLSEVSLVLGTVWRKWWADGSWVLDDGIGNLHERRF